MALGAIQLIDVEKRYGASTVVDKVSASIASGEFVSLLGPSGSGKTTTLMMVAGFVRPDSGSIVVDGSDVSLIPAQKRGFGMVFQNYSLFPHLNVFDNIAFPLRLRRVERTELTRRVQEALDLVQLGAYGDRRITQLSGGQQQRVALARAVVFQPRVVLMDEPMGALDKNLRFAMQTEIKEIQQRLGMTVLYVTHDQEEAMNMSDRIVIMNNGRIEQIGAPREVYDRPASPFAAAFLGETNLLSGQIASVSQGAATMQVASNQLRCRMTKPLPAGVSALLFIRPERLTISAPEHDVKPGANRLPGTVARHSFLGNIVRYAIVLADGQKATVDCQNTGEARLYQPGEAVVLSFSPEQSEALGEQA